MSRGKNIYQATPFGSCLLWGWVDYNSNLFCVVVLCAERRRQIESPSPSKRILQHSCMLYSLCSWVCAWFHALLLGILVLRKPLVHRVRKTYYETKECKNKSREDKRLRLYYSEVPKNCLKSIISICIQNGILAKCVSIRKPPFRRIKGIIIRPLYTHWLLPSFCQIMLAWHIQRWLKHHRQKLSFQTSQTLSSRNVNCMFRVS